jgi:hypothetical protein
VKPTTLSKATAPDGIDSSSSEEEENGDEEKDNRVSYISLSIKDLNNTCICTVSPNTWSGSGRVSDEANSSMAPSVDFATQTAFEWFWGSSSQPKQSNDQQKMKDLSNVYAHESRQNKD